MLVLAPLAWSLGDPSIGGLPRVAEASNFVGLRSLLARGSLRAKEVTQRLEELLGGVWGIADIDDVPWLSTRTWSHNGIREVPDVFPRHRAAGPEDVLGIVPSV
jgi:hypothetical protein